jgi:hypothetical protein
MKRNWKSICLEKRRKTRVRRYSPWCGEWREDFIDPHIRRGCRLAPYGLKDGGGMWDIGRVHEYQGYGRKSIRKVHKSYKRKYRSKMRKEMMEEITRIC